MRTCTCTCPSAHLKQVLVYTVVNQGGQAGTCAARELVIGLTQTHKPPRGVRARRRHVSSALRRAGSRMSCRTVSGCFTYVQQPHFTLFFFLALCTADSLPSSLALLSLTVGGAPS